ncbi:MAG: ChaN family lipoprotein [Gemmatimonadota bacterium]
MNAKPVSPVSVIGPSVLVATLVFAAVPPAHAQEEEPTPDTAYVPVEELPDGVDTGPPPPPPGAHAQMGNQLQSQVLWDATMAYWINDALLRRPDALVLHAVGSFHVARDTGIPEQLRRYRPGASSMIIMLRAVEDIETFEPAPAGRWGDFVIQTDESRTLEAIECRQLLQEIGRGGL